MLNSKIFYFFNSFAGRNEFLDSIIVFIANDLPWILIAFTAVYLIFLKKSPKRFVMLSIVVLLSAAVTEFLKWIVFNQPRPFIALPDVTQLINIASFGSFPSQHATIFAALATGMFIYNRKVGAWIVFFSILIGLARIASGIHFPADILTGFLIGFLVSYISYRLFRGFVESVKKYVS